MRYIKCRYYYYLLFHRNDINVRANNVIGVALPIVTLHVRDMYSITCMLHALRYMYARCITLHVRGIFPVTLTGCT